MKSDNYNKLSVNVVGRPWYVN